MMAAQISRISYSERREPMKSVTEFANFALKAGLTAREALVAEGKALEEVAQGLGEKFKLRTRTPTTSNASLS
jgi:hypothetical protein